MEQRPLRNRAAQALRLSKDLRDGPDRERLLALAAELSAQADMEENAPSISRAIQLFALRELVVELEERARAAGCDQADSIRTAIARFQREAGELDAELSSRPPEV